MARKAAESNRGGIEAMLRMMVRAGPDYVEKKSMQGMLARGLAYGIPAARELFFTSILPVISREPGGDLARALGWSEQSVRAMSRTPGWMRRLKLRRIRPGETVVEAPFQNGVVLRPGDPVEFWSVDFDAYQLEPEGRFRVTEIRQMAPGRFDVYYGRKAGEVVCDVGYVGRTHGGALVIAEDEKQTKVLEAPDPAACIAPPPPPGDGEFQAFEERVGLTLTATIRGVFAFRESQHRLPLPKWGNFAGLKQIWPYFPPRTLALVAGLCDGLALAVHFPREGSPPFLVVASPSWPGVRPWDPDVATALRDPERFAAYCDGDFKKRSAGSNDWLRWLQIDPEAPGPAEHQFLRPLLCDQEYLGSESLQGLLAPLFARFGAEDDLSRIIRDHVCSIADVVSPARWMALSERLETSGRPSEALRAMEHAQKAALAGRAGGIWRATIKVLEPMRELMTRVGDRFDQAWIEAVLPVAKDFAK